MLHVLFSLLAGPIDFHPELRVLYIAMPSLSVL